jgi:HSP20 family protein
LVPRRASSRAALGWSDFDRLFDQLWNGAGLTRESAEASYAPRIDFTETDTEMRVAAELPGLEEKDIQVSLDDGVLTIRGERKPERRARTRRRSATSRPSTASTSARCGCRRK